jgi:tryptophan-rich sensory protein
MEQAILRSKRRAPQCADGDKKSAATHITASGEKFAPTKFNDAAKMGGYAVGSSATTAALQGAAKKAALRGMAHGSAKKSAPHTAATSAATITAATAARATTAAAAAKKYKLTLTAFVFGALILLAALSLLLIDVGGRYLELIKPPFTPSGGAVKTVFIFIYILTALAYITVCGKKFNAEVTKFVVLCLSLNLVWFLFFFILNLRFVSFVLIAANLTASLLCLYKFHHFNRKSGYMLLPYFVWMCFILTLNYAILMLN